MRLGILSDTHNQLDRTLAAVKLLVESGADALIHCGDLMGPEIVQACACAGRPFWFVLGNNDDDWPAVRVMAAQTGATCLEWGGEVTLHGKRIAVTHGHMTKDVRRLKDMKPDYFLFGHSHIAEDRRDGTIRCINPGALHRASSYTVALLDLDTDDLRFLEVGG